MGSSKYYKTEHYAKVLEFTKTVTLFKTKRKTFLDRTNVKNTIIMTHVLSNFVRLAGPWDGLRGSVNYKRIFPRCLPAGGPATPWDAHVMEWQRELVQDGHILEDEMLSPASICMLINWAVAKQPANAAWKAKKIAWSRNIALATGFMLHRDVMKLEELNYPEGLHISPVTSPEDQEDQDDV